MYISNTTTFVYKQTWKSIIAKTEALSEKIRSQAELIHDSTHAKLQVLIADRRAAKQLFQDEKAAFESELNRVGGSYSSLVNLRQVLGMDCSDGYFSSQK